MADTPKPATNGRRKLLINPKFQLSFLAYLVGTALAVIAIFYGANWYFFHRFEQLGQSAGLPSDHVFFTFLRDQARAMNVIYGVTASVAFLFLVATGLVLSHRVAGPLLRLRNHLNRIADGGPDGELSFRKKDYFLEIAEAYNRALAKRK